MQTIELTAKSVDEAKTIAASKLGVTTDQITITVLEETKGLFGKTNLRVRADVAEAKPAAPPKAEKPARSARGKAKADVAPEPAPEPEPDPEAVAVAEPAAKPQRGRRGAKAEAPATAAAPESESSGAEAAASQADADNFLGVLSDLIEKSGLSINAKCTGFSGKYVNIQFDGKDTGYLIGKHGEVLNSFQYLTNIVAAQQWGNGIRAVLDGNDYRSNREEQLTQLATKIAEQVKKRGEEAVLDALPAFERRIVHKALSELDGITTYSEGEEPNRRVVIAPAD